jgi:hypothetical protein
MNSATFFITTARSGTQWLCATLRDIYPDVLTVEHEPIRYAYAPKRYLRNPGAIEELRRDPIVREHFGAIHRTLKTKPYVEVGFPAFAAAPLLWEEFGERLRLVQLVRHPVRVAASIVTHRWFDDAGHRGIQANIALEPFDPGVILRHYETRWAEMSSFEKALFYWAEVHLYGLDVQHKFFVVPFLRVTFEDLLAQTRARTQLTHFLGMPYRAEWDKAPARRVDSYHYQTSARIDGAAILSHPEISTLAARFGYDVAGIAEREIRDRYHRSWVTTLHWRARRTLGKTMTAGAAVGLALSQLTDVLPA